jgi:hypothetical protein
MWIFGEKSLPKTSSGLGSCTGDPERELFLLENKELFLSGEKKKYLTPRVHLLRLQ